MGDEKKSEDLEGVGGGGNRFDDDGGLVEDLLEDADGGFVPGLNPDSGRTLEEVEGGAAANVNQVSELEDVDGSGVMARLDGLILNDVEGGSDQTKEQLGDPLEGVEGGGIHLPPAGTGGDPNG